MHRNIYNMQIILDKTVKLWKISERERKMAEGSYNLRFDDGADKPLHGSLSLPKLVPMELIVEASPRRVYANAHTCKFTFDYLPYKYTSKRIQFRSRQLNKC